MNKTRKNRRRSPGQALVEFTLVGIPIIFVLISIFEVSRGMWLYHTLAYSAKVGVRYASVHGINCIGSAVNPKLQNPNDCAVKMGPADTQGTVAYVIRQAAVGLDPTKTTITFIDSGIPVTCNLDVSGGASSGGVLPVSGDHMANLRSFWYLYLQFGGRADPDRYHDAFQQRYRHVLAWGKDRKFLPVGRSARLLRIMSSFEATQEFEVNINE